MTQQARFMSRWIRNTTYQSESFFIVWGETFNENQILDYVVDEDHEIIVTLDGQRVYTYEDTVVDDQEVLRIRYREK